MKNCKKLHVKQIWAQLSNKDISIGLVIFTDLKMTHLHTKGSWNYLNLQSKLVEDL